MASNTSLNEGNTKAKSSFQASDPYRVLELCESLTDSTSACLQLKINKYFKSTTGAAVVFLITLLEATEEAIIQVVGEHVLEREMRFPLPHYNQYRESFSVRKINSKISADNKIQRDTINSETTDGIGQSFVGSLNPELHVMLQCIVPQSTTCLTIPVIHPKHKNVAMLVCLVDFTDRPNAKEYYSSHVEETFRYCLTHIMNTIAYEEERRLKRQCQSLLSVARKLFSHLGDLNDLLKEIMAEARQLTKAERCSLFLLDPDHQHLVAKVFDGVAINDNQIKEVRITKNQGIAGHVAVTGKVLNIRDAYRHPLFFKGMDESTGFKTRNILCFPIRDEKGIIGVAQLCNKMDGLYFDLFDEEVALAFSIYCGISIMHSIVYKKIQDAQARSKLSNELMIYHMKVSQADIKAVLHCNSQHDCEKFEKLSFSPRDIPKSETVCYTLKIFEEMDFLTKFRIKKETLVRFILYVKKGYRDPPYHNWMHAFSVAHFAYLLLVNFQLIEKSYITDLEGLAFVVACLCHDLDHRGTNNTFQTQSGSVLASLYSSEGSVMERHHLSQAICILNTESCNIFENLSSQEYRHCLDCMRDNILSTDLAHHFRVSKHQTVIVKDYNKTNGQHRQYLMSMLMTCADLSDQTKDWIITKKIAELIYSEFFSQGDLEKSMGNNPIEMMDREKASIPDLQIDFLNTVVIPLYSNLAELFPEGNALLNAVILNRECWQLSKPLFAHYCRRGSDAIDVLKSTDLDVLVHKVKSKLEVPSGIES